MQQYTSARAPVSHEKTTTRSSVNPWLSQHGNVIGRGREQALTATSKRSTSVLPATPHGAILSIEKLLSAGRDDQEITKFCNRRMRQVEIAIFVQHAVASAFAGGQLRNDRKLAFVVRAGNSQFRGFSSANVQHVRGGRIINVVDTVACVRL